MKGEFKNKKVLVMGLGLHGGGAGAVEFLARQGAELVVTDLRTRRELMPVLKGLSRFKGIRYVLGRHRKRDFLEANVIVKNPGVKPDSSYLTAARAGGVPITSDVGIFMRLCPAKMIGVTGTRGKSTATYLIWKFLQFAHTVRSRTPNKKRVFYGGNIRRSVLSLLPRIRKGDLVVLELSSFQLEDLALEKKSPEVAVITNLMRDHLDRYRSMTEYVAAKSVIFKFQKPGDLLFINRGDPRVKRMTRRAPGRVRGVSIPRPFAEIADRNLGPHYRSSVGLAIAVARHFGISDSAIGRALGSFRGLEGREQEIAVVRGVHFINDTTATIPEAAIAAIDRFRRMAGRRNRLILIAGGQDKKLDFRRMASVIRESVDRLALLPGIASAKLRRELCGQNPLHYRGLASIVEGRSMPEAVKAAYRAAKKGDYIVLSPGAASFGLFLNEFDRGDQFADCVRKLKTRSHSAAENL